MIDGTAKLLSNAYCVIPQRWPIRTII